jgi:hypothetical protein
MAYLARWGDGSVDADAVGVITDSPDDDREVFETATGVRGRGRPVAGTSNVCQPYARA